MWYDFVDEMSFYCERVRRGGNKSSNEKLDWLFWRETKMEIFFFFVADKKADQLANTTTDCEMLQRLIGIVDARKSYFTRIKVWGENGPRRGPYVAAVAV